MKHTASLLGLVMIGSFISACGKDTPPPATPDPTQQQQQYPQQQYPQQQQQYPQTQQYPQQQQQYPQTQQYPQQQYPQAAPTAAAPTTAAPAAGGTMATPGPLALPCQNDSACGFARCNTQYGKCAFPCLSQVDCGAGNSCNTMTGLCLPGAH
jgi:hypothetical protein